MHNLTLKGRPAKRAEAPLKGSKVSKPTHPAGRRSNAAREIAAARAVTARIGACMCMRRSPICPGAPGGPLRPTGPSAPRSPSRPSRPAGPGGPAGPCRRRPLPRVRGGRGEEGDDVGQREDGGRRRQSHPTVTVVALLTPLARGKRGDGGKVTVVCQHAGPWGGERKLPTVNARKLPTAPKHTSGCIA